MPSTVLGGQIPHVILSLDTSMFHLLLKSLDVFTMLMPWCDKLGPKSSKRVTVFS